MSANLIVGKDPAGNKVPVLVDTAGKLQIGGVQLDNLNVNTDQIEAKQDVTNALLTTTAADVAAVKTQLATGTIAVTGGGGGGGGASAAYNATLPTYTSGASTTLQTDVNGRLITTGPLTDTQLRSSAVPVSAASLPLPSGAATESGNLSTIASEAVIIDSKLPSLSSGRIPVEANNAASQVYNYTATGVVATNSVLIGPIDCAQFREISVQNVAIGSGISVVGQISNNNLNWVAAPLVLQSGVIRPSGEGQTGTGIITFSTHGARFFQVIAGTAQTAGTTTLVAYASQQATPKLYQSVAISNTPGITPAPSSSSGFSTYHSLVSSATTNATNVRNSQGCIGTCVLTNTSTTFKYVKFFNLAVAPTMGTSTPVIQFPVAPNSTLDVGTAFAGFRLGSGISYAITNGSALLDNTAVGAGEVLVNLTFA